MSAEGVAQAEAAATALHSLDVRVIVSSDLARARMTAEILARAAGVEVVIQPALRERNIGLWTGLTSSEIDSRWPGQRQAYRDDPQILFPDGEDADAVVRRAGPVLLAIAEEAPPAGVTIAVSHGGVIRCLRLALGGTDLPVSHMAGCWIEAREHGLRLVSDIELGSGRTH